MRSIISPSTVTEISSFDDSADSEVIERLLEHLYDEGFESEAAEETEPETRRKNPKTWVLMVTMPRALLHDSQLNNLKKMIAAKNSPVSRKPSRSRNFRSSTQTRPFTSPGSRARSMPNTSVAYTSLITAMCNFAKEAKRINAKEKEATNAKYEFRVSSSGSASSAMSSRSTVRFSLKPFRLFPHSKTVIKHYAPGCDPIPTPRTLQYLILKKQNSACKTRRYRRRISEIFSNKDGE
jgi:hypothetical protein